MSKKYDKIFKLAKNVYAPGAPFIVTAGALVSEKASGKKGVQLKFKNVSQKVISALHISLAVRKQDGSKFNTGITNPSGGDYSAYVSVADGAVATSGDYERFYEVDGERYHHIIDPKTNFPAAYFSSVSVFTKDSGLADALSTALFCMSYEDGLALAKKLGGVDVIWVDADGGVKMTDGIKVYS